MASTVMKSSNSARARMETLCTLAPKSTAPVLLQIKQVFHSQCSSSLVCSLTKLYLVEKSLDHWERAKSSKGRVNSEGTEEERKNGEAFLLVFRICTQVPVIYLCIYF